MSKTTKTKTIEEMSFKERVDWAAGYILQELIKGKFYDAVWMVADQFHRFPLKKD